MRDGDFAGAHCALIPVPVTGVGVVQRSSLSVPSSSAAPTTGRESIGPSRSANNQPTIRFRKERCELLTLLGGGFPLVWLVDPFAAGPFPFETLALFALQ